MLSLSGLDRPAWRRPSTPHPRASTCSLWIGSAGLALPERWDPKTTTLEEALEQSRAYWQDEDGAMPKGFVDALNKSLTELVQAGLENDSVQIGTAFLDFELQNQRGDTLTSAALLSGGPVIVTFYRVGWCPYCNLALRAMQAKLPEFRKLGASLVAVSPEKPDDSLTTSEKNELEFDVLFDEGSRLADAAGIIWDIPEYALEWHEKYFGLYLEEHNGQGNRSRLPVPSHCPVPP